MQKTAQRPLGKQAKLIKTQKRVQQLLKKKRIAEAKRLCDVTFAQGVHTADFLHLHGQTLIACGNYEDALVKTFAAHEREPENAQILNTLGRIFLAMKDLDTAIEMFKRATAQDDKFYDAWLRLANTLRSAGRLTAAELAYKCAYHLDRANPAPLFDITLMLVDSRRYVEAAEIMDDLLKTHQGVTTAMRLKRLQVAMRLEDMDYVTEHKNGFDRTSLNNEELADLDAVNAQYHIVYDQIDEAITILENIVDRKSQNQADHLTHLGFCYGLVGRLDDGISVLKNLLKINPSHAAARHNLALLQFRKGELADGFDNYKARTEITEFSSKRRIFNIPPWQGEPIRGKKILVWREQGIGDEVRFASLLPDLHRAGASITFECSEKLIPVWEKSFPWAKIKTDGKINCVDDPDYAEFDFHIPIGSLGAYFRRSISEFQEKQTPWIVKDREQELKIRGQLAVQEDELLVGICWRSSLQVASRNKVFLNCSELTPLNALKNVRWLNVQYASEDEELATIRDNGLALHHYSDLDQKNDMTGACNLIGACDLILSVGVSVGDLAGGIGTPMVHIGPESSEIYLGTDKIPWFVNAKSYPIEAYNGEATIRKIVNEWPAILRWVKEIKPKQEGLASGCNTSGKRAKLDLLYHA